MTASCRPDSAAELFAGPSDPTEGEATLTDGAGVEHRQDAEEQPRGHSPGDPRQARLGHSTGRLRSFAQAEFLPYSRTWMFLSAQISLSCLGQTVTVTSPRCAARSRYMYVLA